MMSQSLESSGAGRLSSLKNASCAASLVAAVRQGRALGKRIGAGGSRACKKPSEKKIEVGEFVEEKQKISLTGRSQTLYY